VLDLLSNVEPVMHAAVRRRAPLAEPPRLSVERQSEREVLIVYSSPRKLCEFARGLIEGLAQFFDEDVRISETACMHEGAAACRLLVTKR
jgi:predicted hydrocarbon binding protein